VSIKYNYPTFATNYRIWRFRFYAVIFFDIQTFYRVLVLFTRMNILRLDESLARNIVRKYSSNKQVYLVSEILASIDIPYYT
jgi:hypothetical protein